MEQAEQQVKQYNCIKQKYHDEIKWAVDIVNSVPRK